MLIKLTTLLDEAKCYEVIRQLRWPDGVVCLHCRGTGVVRNGHDDRERHRQRYLCKTCKYRFDDLTGTVLAGHHQLVSTWILGSYFMGVNLSNRQIAHELGLCESDVQAMTEVLRHGIVAKTPDVVLSGDVEFDELYVVAGHKGNPEAVRAKGREGRRNRLKGGRGTLEKEKPPIFGMIERGGNIVIRMLANVQQATIHPRAIAYEKSGRWFTAEEPSLRAKKRTDTGSSAFRHPRSELIAPLPQEAEAAFNNRKLHMRLPCHPSDHREAKGSNVYTDEYGIYARLPGLGYSHKTVCHGRGEYARDGDGFCEVNTLEGFWSLLRSWLHRGISQEKLPLYLGFFQFVHNVRRRGKALLGSLIEAPEPTPHHPGTRQEPFGIPIMGWRCLISDTPS